MHSWNLLYLAALLSVSAALPQVVEPSISVASPISTLIASTVEPTASTGIAVSSVAVPSASTGIAVSSAAVPSASTGIAISSTVEPTATGTAITSTVEPTTSGTAITSTVEPTSSGTTTAPTTVLPTTTSAPPPSSTPIPSFKLHPNGNAAKCLEVRGDVRANGTPVQIFDCNGTPAQNWIIALGEGPVVLAGTNFCLDAGSAPANGVGMKIWECFSNLPAQDWFYTTDQRIALTNQGFCLDLTNGNLANANQVQTWKCTDNDVNQIWSISN